jgi:hypothetical protein
VAISLIKPAYILLDASANLLASPFDHTKRHLTTPRFPVSDKPLFRKMLPDGCSVHQSSISRQQITTLAAPQQWDRASPKCGEKVRQTIQPRL